MPTYSFTSVQQGNENASGSWSSLPTLSSTNTGGYRWAMDLPGKLWQSANLVIEDTLASGGTGTATVSVVDLHNVPTFSASYRPSRTQQILVGTGTGTPSTSGGLVIPLSLNTSAGQATRLKASMGGGTTVYNLGLVVTWSGSSFLAGVSLVGTYSDETFTGLEGPWRAQGRADRCPRCGMPSTRDTWVRDGYLPGMRVCPKCYDPPDEVGRSVRVGSERPPEGEN